MANLHLIISYLALHFIIMNILAGGGHAGQTFNVQTYGAVGNGMNDDTQAFTKAWNAASHVSSATLLVPAGKTFLVNNLLFQGPCAEGFIFQVDGKIIAPADPNSWKDKTVWLRFDELQQFTLQGSGTIDGQGNNWWSHPFQLNDYENGLSKQGNNAPSAIQFNGGSHVIIQGLSIMNSPRFHLTFTSSNNIQIISVKISAPGTSPNTDGIDINGGSTDFRIISCNVGTGDDCVAIGSGSKNIYIKDLTCGPGHGISVGSLGKGNSEAQVSTVHVDGANLTATTNGLRIKTWQGGSGSASGIIFEKVKMVNVANPIIIDQYYCDSPKPCPNQTSAVHIYNVTYNGISGTSSTPVAVRFACSDTVACTDIKMSNISLTLNSGAQATSYCKNAKGKTIGPVDPPSCLQS